MVKNKQTNEHNVTAKAIEQCYHASCIRILLTIADSCSHQHLFAGMDYAETYKAAQGVNLLLGRLCTVRCLWLQVAR